MGKWETVRLGDVGQIITGNTPKTSDSSNFNSDDIPFFKPGDFYANGITPLLGAESFVSNNAKGKIRILPADSILVTCIGIIGKVGITGREAICNQQINAILPNERYNSRYVAYAIMHSRNQLNHIANAAVVPIVNKTQFSNLQIPLPPLVVQQQIADVLDRASALIEKRKAQIDKLDLLVKSQFIAMFGDPVTNPMGWEVRKLKEITMTIQSGNTPKGGKQVYVDSGIMFFRSQNVWRNRIELDDIAYIDEKIHKKMSQTRLKNKDILITKTGRFNTENSSLGRAALFLGENESANINGHVYLVRLKERSVHEYILYILITDEYRDYIRKVCVGGIDKRQINKEHLEEFPIIMPPVELQHQFAGFFLQVEAQKSMLQKSLSKLELNYKSLMQKCFRGEIF